MQHEFGAVEFEARWQGWAGCGANILEAEDLAAAIAVEMRMTMVVAAANLEAPGAFAAGDTLRDPLFDEPVERPVKGDAVMHDAVRTECGADLVMRERMRRTLQRLDDGDARACHPPAMCGDQVAGRSGGRRGGGVVGHVLGVGGVGQRGAG